jgi:alkanesulfonate monooxygenase SsuD/methylene tetrahydromethanopterin reductase-like flavin-dependent oxidoreductase (luciferase family)
LTSWLLYYDMRAPDIGAPIDRLYAAALEQCAWADARGLPLVQVSEHHGSPDGYLPSPFVLAAAIAARTTHARIRLAALVPTLRDPVAAAEDAVVLDLVSGGRLEAILAAGYVPSEFAMFGVDYDGRAAVFEAKATAFLQALAGEEFDYEGRRGRVTPGPLQRPRPPVIFGGATPAAARRAARLGDGYMPAVPDDELSAHYEAECERQGRTPNLISSAAPMGVHVAEDPDRAWALLGPHALHETNAYAKWSSELPGSNPWVPIDDADAVRAVGLYAVVTPEQCVELFRSLDPRANLILKPLIGGLDTDVGWSSLELFVEKVLPELTPDTSAGA